MKWCSGIFTCAIILFVCTSFISVNNSLPTYYVIIDKSDYELSVYDADG